jgi:hypothetical protein
VPANAFEEEDGDEPEDEVEYDDEDLEDSLANDDE